MKRKNLEKAIILGLMAASISVPVWAKDINEQIVDDRYNKTYAENINIKFDNPANDEQAAIQPSDDKSVEINTGNNTISISSPKGTGISTGGGNVSITAGNNIITAASTGINIENSGTVFLAGDNIEINVINAIDDINHSWCVMQENGTFDVDISGNFKINSVFRDQEIGAPLRARGISSYDGNLNVNVGGILDIDSKGNGATGIYVSKDKKADIFAKESIMVNAIGTGNETYAYYTFATNSNLKSDGDINLEIENYDTYDDVLKNVVRAESYGENEIFTANIDGKNVTLTGKGKEIFGVYNSYWQEEGIVDAGNILNITAVDNIKITTKVEDSWTRGIYTEFADTNLKANNITITAETIGKDLGAYGIWANQYETRYPNYNNSKVNLESTNENYITATTRGIYATAVDYDDEHKAYKSSVTLSGNKNTIDSKTGIYSTKSFVELNAKGANGANTVYADYSADNGFGSGHAIRAASKATVNLNAVYGNNNLYGVVYAKDEGTVVTLDHNITDKNGDIVGKGSGNNIIMSSAHGSEAEGRDHVVAALYAQSNGKIDISAGNGGVNYITTEFDFNAGDKTEKESERTIWAQQGGKINIEGQTYIIASNADKYTENVAGNARGIAITAGSETIPTEGIDTTNRSIIDIKDELRSHVTLAYNGGSNGLQSFAQGDIVSGYGGIVDVYDTDKSGLFMMGNALAANGGKLNLDIGNGGTWYGRADDYGDAGVIKDDEHTTFFDPAFSNEIVQGGQVNLTMGEGSRWNVTGQSWITSINTGNSDIAAGTPIIDLVNANTDREKTAHALTIYNLNGNAIFNMSLAGDRNVSDMLYIKNADGEYVINVVDSVSVDDMYKGGFDGLRFATIGDGSNVSFRAITYNQGINNVEYEVGQDAYNKENSKENDAYNSSETDGGMNSDKPGSDRVEGFFDSTGTPENPQGPDDTEIMTLENTVESDSNVNGTTNFKLIGVKDSERSDGGKTVVNMSKVNYSNAVYMDRLNKRLGEARYINTEEDQGMWVRMRHDRIGKDNEFRIMNTMYELGYDEKQECDNGERRVGAAIDYMDGSSEYTGVGGSGDVSRKGIWLYDTWLGDKGHYSDFVAKWGHLSNDFTLYRGGDKITGDFSNNVYSISAEYGRKKDIGNNWYFEPQVQLQYARVTDANYTTSQGTEVSLDAINSLIARAGFRLGKDLGERSTVYFKADVLHEFLGDQDIYAHDKTGTMDVTYGNEGTWCDIGFGFATAMSKTSYAYLDVETSLGNDYEETYQINAGLQWSF